MTSFSYQIQELEKQAALLRHAVETTQELVKANEKMLRTLGLLSNKEYK